MFVVQALALCLGPSACSGPSVPYKLVWDISLIPSAVRSVVFAWSPTYPNNLAPIRAGSSRVSVAAALSTSSSLRLTVDERVPVERVTAPCVGLSFFGGLGLFVFGAFCCLLLTSNVPSVCSFYVIIW